ncbi:PREDICTED: DNA repair protein XRCC3-like [Papilio polytes]|uniref:DNA repair protein XRCC3-like n=1 Tax=Papilio polytes TaxID=76194 RepID=UPI000675C022|nr:PREDICTED: DNA repair protein XRCC3-like [Papilio polytes]
MDILQSFLPLRMIEKIEKAGIGTPLKLLTLSVLDLKKLTNLTADDIAYLKDAISNYCKPPCITCDKLMKLPKFNKIPTGCKNIDSLLHGGFAAGTITELYGESGSGKTQIGITTALNSWPNKSVYICTEDIFPVKRLKQMADSLSAVNDHCKHIFVEHLTEPHELCSCIKVRLPRLLEQNEVSTLIIDSIAAPFRCESTNYMKRAEDLREIAIMLLTMAQKYNFAIICINQVTASFEGALNVLPSLGLAWSNLVTYRLWLQKQSDTSNSTLFQKGVQSNNTVRELSVVFAPDLPNSSTHFIITSEGLKSI